MSNYNESKIIIGTALNGHIRFYLGDTTKLVEDARLIHDLWPTSLAALGRTMSVTACMGLRQKNDNESITTTINGGGKIGTILVSANSKGEVKGFVGDPHCYLKYNDGNKLAVGLVVGTNGYLKVLKNLQMKQNYVSSVALQTGEIGDDFAYYFKVSEQTSTVVSVGVLVNEDYSCKASGILLLELMPNHTEEDIVYLENLVKQLEPISTVISRNNNLKEYIKSLFTDGNILEEKNIKYFCDCSKERFLENLLTLPKKDLLDLSKDESIEVKCEFCNKKYLFDKKEIVSLTNYVKNRKS